MCFSATASFAASAALGAVGVASVASARRPGQLAFAAMPLVFAAQQCVEGLLWRTHALSPSWRVGSPLVRTFLFFALLLWPVYLPVACGLMERARPRARRAMLAALAPAGLVLGAYLFGRLAARPVYSCVAAQHLYYTVGLDPPARLWINAAYAAVVLAPLVLSSVRGTTALAAVLAASFAASAAYFRATFVSVWCFAAALSSVGVALIVARDRGPRGGARTVAVEPHRPLPGARRGA